MMKAAYDYYQKTTNTTRKVSNKITLGEWSSGSNAVKMRVKNRPPRKPKVVLTPEETAFMNLVNSGQICALIAHYAPTDF